VSVLARIVPWYVGPTDGRPLALFERALTLALFVYMTAWWQHAGEWLGAQSFHLSPAASGGLQWPVPAVPEAVLPVLAIVFFGAMAAVILGRGGRWAIAVVLVIFAYVTAADRLSAFSANKIYVASYVVLLLAPRRDSDGAIASAWPLRVLQITLLAQYFGAGLCKAVYGDWSAYPDTLWAQVQSEYRTDLAALAIGVLPKWVWSAMQYGVVAFELATPVLFLVPRLRPVGIAIGVAMHLGIGLLLYQVVYFGLQSLAFYVLFLPERWTARTFERLRRQPTTAEP